MYAAVQELFRDAVMKACGDYYACGVYLVEQVVIIRKTARLIFFPYLKRALQITIAHANELHIVHL